MTEETKFKVWNCLDNARERFEDEFGSITPSKGGGTYTKFLEKEINEMMFNYIVLVEEITVSISNQEKNKHEIKKINNRCERCVEKASNDKQYYLALKECCARGIGRPIPKPFEKFLKSLLGEQFKIPKKSKIRSDALRDEMLTMFIYVLICCGMQLSAGRDKPNKITAIRLVAEWAQCEGMFRGKSVPIESLSTKWAKSRYSEMDRFLLSNLGEDTWIDVELADELTLNPYFDNEDDYWGDDED